MTRLHDVLRAGSGAALPAAARRGTALVVGGGGALGSAVLERLLAQRRHAHVKVAVTRGFVAAMHGLEPVVIDAFDAPSASTQSPSPLADIALIVFDRERHANGRELAFARPRPQALPTMARWLAGRGVRALIVVLPHAPASLPDALKVGFADLDEQAVAAMGFEHLVIVRSAQAPSGPRARRWLQRLADGVLSQLQIMVAASNQPVRAAKVAQFVADLAALLPASVGGTRVAPPELVWQAAQLRDPAPMIQAWLAGGELPPLRAPRRRM